jgi:hypothetical protein
MHQITPLPLLEVSLSESKGIFFQVLHTKFAEAKKLSSRKMQTKHWFVPCATCYKSSPASHRSTEPQQPLEPSATIFSTRAKLWKRQRKQRKVCRFHQHRSGIRKILARQRGSLSSPSVSKIFAREGSFETQLRWTDWWVGSL